MSVLHNIRVLTYLTRNRIFLTINELQKRKLRGVPKHVPEASSELAKITTTLDECNQIAEKPKTTIPDPVKSIDSKIVTTHDNYTSELDKVIDNMLNDESGLAPSFNLAAYVNQSNTLQQLVQLGVDLHRIERRKGLGQFVLNLNFDENVKPHLLFLKNHGIPPECYGELITKNPLIFKVDLDDLETRVNYLEAKKFTSAQCQRILIANPFWLMFSTRRIDRRLGYFQQEFRLSGDDVRFLTTKQPRLITYNMEHIHKSTFCIREEMGFDEDEIKALLLAKPRLWMMNSDILIERFAYAHTEMQLSHDMLLQFPEILTSREFRLRERHEFLKLLGRAQYDPTKDLYISPKIMVTGTNYYFARKIAKSDVETYELFLKTR